MHDRQHFVEVEYEYLTDAGDREVATVWATVRLGAPARRSGHPDTWEPPEPHEVVVDRVDVWSDATEDERQLGAVELEEWEREHLGAIEDRCVNAAQAGESWMDVHEPEPAWMDGGGW